MATQSSSPREVRFTSSALGPDKVLFSKMQVREELGRLSQMRVEVVRTTKAAAAAPLVAKDMLGTLATVELLVDPEAETKRYFNGHIVGCANIAEAQGSFTAYALELRPWLWFLTRGFNSRIFQDKTAVEILDAVFAGYGTPPVEKHLNATYRPRAICVQYRECDFDFVSRLMEEEGIYYYFKHTAATHTLVLCDNIAGHQPLPGDGLSDVKDAQTSIMRDDHVWSWERNDSIQSLKYVQTEYDFQNPSTDLTVTATAAQTGLTLKLSDMEVFDYPGAYDDPHVAAPGGKKNHGARLAKLRVEEFEARQAISSGATSFRPMAVGWTFAFTGHAQAGSYLVTAANYLLDFGQHEARSDADAGSGFTCSFEAIPKDTRFRSLRTTPLPFVHGPQTALVVGASSDEILTDKHGRIKVQFRWDRVGQKNDSSSCWIRVAHPWAGKGFGMIALPRVGHEVVVDFLEGNPDRPLVTGSVYNAENMPPYALPAQATVSGIRTHSSKEGTATTFNELRFDDKKGSEYVWLQAEKEYFRFVKGNAFDWVKGNETVKVTLTRKEVIGENWYLDVGKDVKHNIGKDLHVNVAGDVFLTGGATWQVKIATDISVKAGGAAGIEVTGATDIKSGGDLALFSDGVMFIKASQNLLQQAGQKLSLKAGTDLIGEGASVKLKGRTIALEAGTTLTLKAGSSFISLGPAGVDIQGSMVKINSGGSAGPADAAAAVRAASPTAPTAALTMADLLPGQATTYDKQFKDPLAPAA